MKSLEVAEANAPLAEYARDVKNEPLLLTINGKPVVALIPIENADVETVTLSTHPQFLTERGPSGIGMLTPAMVHDGRAPQVMEDRVPTLPAAFEAHPERFKGEKPAPRPLPETVWINRPPEVSQGAEAESMPSLQ